MSNSLFRRKNISSILAEGSDESHASGGLHRVLTVKDLTFFGIAAILGAGSFSSLGYAVFHGGPGVRPPREEGSKGADTAELERTVASLKEELAEIKARPVAATAETADEPAPKPVKKKRTPKPAPEDEAYTPSAPAPVAAPAVPEAVSPVPPAPAPAKVSPRIDY